jgi:FixJ family two-component response regulator
LLVSVDDNESVRKSLPDLLRKPGFVVRTILSAEEFLASGGISQASCLIPDIGLPGASGPELQRELERQRMAIPVIFVTGHRGAAARLRMLEEGMVECLFKPFSDTALLEALNTAVVRK